MTQDHEKPRSPSLRLLPHRPPPGTIAVTDPYTGARFDRYNHAAEQYRALRRALVVCLVLGAVVLFQDLLLVRLATRARYQPYVVHVDRHGHAVAAGAAEPLGEPGAAILLDAVATWITSARLVTGDRALQDEAIRRAYAYTSGRATELLNSHYRREPPYARALRERVTVAIEDLETILALDTTRRQYRARWTERVLSPDGTPRRTELWEAVLTLSVEPPDSPEQIQINFAGVKVTDFDLQRLQAQS